MKRVTIAVLAITAAALIGVVALASSCATSSSNAAMDEPLDRYQASVEAAKETGTLEPGSAGENAALERVKNLLSEVSEENIRGHVAEVYAEDAFFNDTLKTLHGAKAIEAYLLETADSLKSSEVKFKDTARSGGNYYLRWEMTYESKVLNKGNDIRTIGMTHLRFNPEGKVIVHQDFWDSTRGIFEHVPVVKTGISLVKKRL